MKKTAIIAGLVLATQIASLNAWDFLNLFKSASSDESSAAVSSVQGGTVTVGDKAYQLAPGQTLQVSGGGVSAQMNTVQEDGKEPVTTILVDESEPVALIDGEPATPIQGVSEDDLTSEEEDEIDEDLDEDDAYED